MFVRWRVGYVSNGVSPTADLEREFLEADTPGFDAVGTRTVPVLGNAFPRNPHLHRCTYSICTVWIQ
jgi:hypothetical protein